LVFQSQAGLSSFFGNRGLKYTNMDFGWMIYFQGGRFEGGKMEFIAK